MTRYRLWLLAMVLFFLTYKEARLHRGLICEGAQFQIMTEAYLYLIPIMSNCLSLCCDLGTVSINMRRQSIHLMELMEQLMWRENCLGL